MARTAKLDLRAFQQELTTRLAAKTAAQVEQSRLGIACAGTQWLIRLSDAGEVIAVPPMASVPLTKPWYLGIANIRGNLYGVVDFAGFLGQAGSARCQPDAVGAVWAARWRASRRTDRASCAGLAQPGRAFEERALGGRAGLVRGTVDGDRRRDVAGNRSGKARAGPGIPAGGVVTRRDQRMRGDRSGWEGTWH